jgi:septation ring formation regulator EzrA
MGAITEVKTDLVRVANQVQQQQQAHINLERTVDTTAGRVTNMEHSISDLHSRLTVLQQKQEEV